MKSDWNDDKAQIYKDRARLNGHSEDLGLRIYTSHLIGGDPDLVLHGGGNTSVKVTNEDGAVIMHIKGSGWDLDTIEAEGLPAVHLAPLLEARKGDKLSDPAMVSLLRNNLLDASSPNPSVEALLHGFIPYKFVDHTHATAVLILANQPDMRETVKRLYGTRVAYVPYVMPGFDLSIEGDKVFQLHPDCEGLWLENHGLFTFADDAKRSYELMTEFVTLAEEELARRNIILSKPQVSDQPADPELTQKIRNVLQKDKQSPFANDLALDYRSTPAIRLLTAKDNLKEITLRGTVTPDHVIRIKPWPLVIAPDANEQDIETALLDYSERYKAYFERNAARALEPKTMLDTYPRLICVKGQGIYACGTTDKAARIGGDLCEQTARVMNAAEEYGVYTPIPEHDLFDMEYWSLEQAKLKK